MRGLGHADERRRHPAQAQGLIVLLGLAHGRAQVAVADQHQGRRHQDVQARELDLARAEALAPEQLLSVFEALA